jgi:glucosamine 6-phosphate synthetase-like amidotransferase/phosphosugar isomerase protein
MAEKGLSHHMIKEIFEQPQVLYDTIAPRISLPEGVVQLNEVY